MIIFNTIKKAEHYVKWCQKNNDFHRNGYDWETQDTFISGDLVVVRISGDGCGCGCDHHLFDYTNVIGRIKDKRTKNLKLLLNN
jgi:hypothetical protein